MIILYIKFADMAKNNKHKQSDDEMDSASRKMQYFCKHSASYCFFPPSKYYNTANSVVHSISTYTDRRGCYLQGVDKTTGTHYNQTHTTSKTRKIWKGTSIMWHFKLHRGSTVAVFDFMILYKCCSYCLFHQCPLVNIHTCINTATYTFIFTPLFFKNTHILSTTSLSRCDGLVA